MAADRREPAPLAIAPDGAHFAAADGPELLVWKSGGAPAWKQFADGILVGLAITVDQVLAVDADGRVTIYRRGDGEPLDRYELGVPAFGLRVSEAGLVAIGGPEGVVLVGEDQRRVLPFAGATAFAFGPGGASLGVGAGAVFTAVEVASGSAWGSVTLDAPIAGVAWSALGSWVVGAGQTIHRISGDAKAVTARIPGADARVLDVAVSSNGLVCAARTAPVDESKGEHVELYELLRDKPLGEFILRRSIGAVTFGPALVLGIGLDDGDANLVDLALGDTYRTEPHKGRGRNTWRLENQADISAIRGVIALHQAGGQEIARWVAPPSSGGGGGGGGGRAGCIAGCLAVLGLVGALVGFTLLVLALLWVAQSTGFRLR